MLLLADINEFLFIWEHIITPISRFTVEESDSNFVEAVRLRYRGEGEWRQRLEQEFHHQRHNFKEQCYGKRRSETGDPLLDSRKVAAVLCKTCLVHKAFEMDVNAASLLAEEKKRQMTDIEYTTWAANNTLINYKFAYLASQGLVYFALCADLLEKEVEMAKELNRTGRLFHYPSEPGCDTMDVNIIVGLARGDQKGQELNMLLYAMLLYQNEMYTRKCLKFSAKMGTCQYDREP